MKYVFQGPVPVPDEAGELVHPLDVREFGTPPDCPPWEPLDDEPAGGPEDSKGDPPGPPEASPAALSAALSAAPALNTAPAAPKGM